MYSEKDIETVLWNTFNLAAEAIELIDTNNGMYKFDVFPVDDTELGELAQMAQELFDSELFDVTMRGDHLEIEYLNPHVMEKLVILSRAKFHIFHENITTWISFDDKQVKALKQRFDNVNVKYHSNTFFQSVMKQLQDKQKLSKKQFSELKYLIDNGKTMYENGILTTKN